MTGKSLERKKADAGKREIGAVYTITVGVDWFHSD